MINSYKSKREENLKNRANQEKEYIKDLKDTIDSYSIKNGRFFISFIIFLFIIFTVATNTTHKDLLFNSLISFPIVRWELPTTVFYTVAPLIILVFHFNILFSLSEHFKRLNQWLNIKDLNEEKKYSLIKPFIFNHLLVYKNKDKIRYLLLKFIIWLTIFVFPLFVLMYLQYKFLPYHDFIITTFQQIIIAIDLILLIIFWKDIDSEDLKIELTFKYIKYETKEFFNDFKLFFKTKFNFDYLSPIIFRILSLFFILLIPFISLYALQIPTKEFQIQDFMLELIGEERNLKLIDEYLIEDKPSDLTIQYYVDKGLNEEEIIAKYSKGLNLKGRDFKFAIFSYSKFYNANLKETNLEGVDFNYAKLNNAYLNEANLKYSKLKDIDLNGSELRDIKIDDYQLNSNICKNKFIAKHFIATRKDYINKHCSQEFKNQLAKEFGFKFENNNSKREI